MIHSIVKFVRGFVGIIGGTDGTKIGNVSDRMKVDALVSGALAPITRTDESRTVTASGNSTSYFDADGYGMINLVFDVTAISGSGAYIQFHVEASDDGATWYRFADTSRLTATGQVRYQGFRLAGRYYRFVWDVGGSSPSITFTAKVTLKSYLPNPKRIRFFYSDIDLTTNGKASSVFDADDCENISVIFTRADDGGSNANVQIFVSNDRANWLSLTANLAANRGTSNDANFSGNAYRYFKIQVTGHTDAGTRTLDINWVAN